MAVLKYTVGNGYSWSNDRQEWHDEFEFYEDGEAYFLPNIPCLIKSCVAEAKANDWDFSIDEVIGYSGNEEALKEQIQDAIGIAAVEKLHEDTVNGIQSLIDGIDEWFANLEQTKKDKMASRALLETRLTEVESAYKSYIGE